MSDRCTYDKTYNGYCDQPSMKDSEVCYYHDKVLRELIEADEENVVIDLPEL